MHFFWYIYVERYRNKESRNLLSGKTSDPWFRFFTYYSFSSHWAESTHYSLTT